MSPEQFMNLNYLLLRVEKLLEKIVENTKTEEKAGQLLVFSFQKFALGLLHFELKSNYMGINEVNFLWNVKDEKLLGLSWGYKCLWIGFWWLIIEIDFENNLK